MATKGKPLRETDREWVSERGQDYTREQEADYVFEKNHPLSCFFLVVHRAAALQTYGLLFFVLQTDKKLAFSSITFVFIVVKCNISSSSSSRFHFRSCFIVLFLVFMSFCVAVCVDLSTCLGECLSVSIRFKSLKVCQTLFTCHVMPNSWATHNNTKVGYK